MTSDFNSNMVRLKEYRRSLSCADTILFQFQYGAIKSIPASVSMAQAIIFQFQYGAIKSFLINGGKSALVEFQFQYGAIKRLASCCNDRSLARISIPIWCD